MKIISKFSLNIGLFIILIGIDAGAQKPKTDPLLKLLSSGKQDTFSLNIPNTLSGEQIATGGHHLATSTLIKSVRSCKKVQKKELARLFDNWKDDLKQVIDPRVIGIKI